MLSLLIRVIGSVNINPIVDQQCHSSSPVITIFIGGMLRPFPGSRLRSRRLQAFAHLGMSRLGRPSGPEIGADRSAWFSYQSKNIDLWWIFPRFLMMDFPKISPGRGVPRNPFSGDCPLQTIHFG